MERKYKIAVGLFVISVFIVLQLWKSGILERETVKISTATFGKPLDENTMKISSNQFPPPIQVCSATFRKPLDENMKKIASYDFSPSIQSNMDYLFPKPANTTPPLWPVFVTAFSDNHFKEAMIQIRCLNENRGNLSFVVYDLGLTKDQHTEVQNTCKCDLRIFPFERFPDHVRTLRGYTFKPLAIQLVLREHPFAVWLDASIRLKTNMTSVIEKARTKGVMVGPSDGTVAMRTHELMFKFLDEDPCAFNHDPEFAATFMIIHEDEFVRTYFMKPWVSCALTIGCMMPFKNSNHLVFCPETGRLLHRCHRFDQSMISILVYRLYHNETEDHVMRPNTFYYKQGL